MSNNNEPGSAAVTVVEKRDERIARYKEERRKQLQAARQQAGLATGTVGHDHSSSSEDLPHEEQSYAKYKWVLLVIKKQAHSKRKSWKKTNKTFGTIQAPQTDAEATAGIAAAGGEHDGQHR